MADRSSSSDIGFGFVGAALGLGLIFVAARYLAPRRSVAQTPSFPPGVPSSTPTPPSPPAPQAPAPAPESRAPAPRQDDSPPPPPGPQRDESRLTFTMIRPGFMETAGPMLFAGPDMRTYSLREMIARVKDGGRFDVTLAPSSARPPSADYARAFLVLSGVEVWDEEGRRWTIGPDSYLVETTGDPDVAQYRVPSDKQVARVAVSGHVRGYYGRVR